MVFSVKSKGDMPLRLEALEKSIRALKRAIEYAADRMPHADDLEQDILKATVIQNFETAYEISCFE